MDMMSKVYKNKLGKSPATSYEVYENFQSMCSEIGAGMYKFHRQRCNCFGSESRMAAIYPIDGSRRRRKLDNGNIPVTYIEGKINNENVRSFIKGDSLHLPEGIEVSSGKCDLLREQNGFLCFRGSRSFVNSAVSISEEYIKNNKKMVGSDLADSVHAVPFEVLKSKSDLRKFLLIDDKFDIKIHHHHIEEMILSITPENEDEWVLVFTWLDKEKKIVNVDISGGKRYPYESSSNGATRETIEEIGIFTSISSTRKNSPVMLSNSDGSIIIQAKICLVKKDEYGLNKMFHITDSIKTEDVIKSLNDGKLDIVSVFEKLILDDNSHP
tara:strand:+ start:45 stop:1022 length:978 start_codon:yes stop_codon:yes gene_type:complete